MFDYSYPVTKLFSKDFGNKGHLKSKTTHLFKTELDESYIIEVEEYSHNIYIIKFCPKKLKKHPKRFNVLVGGNKMPKIVGTCIQLMIGILKKNNLANFGFLGSNTITFDAKKKEPKSNTIRYRIYKYAVTNYISEQTFDHHTDLRNSTYLVINKKHDNREEILKQANRMFDELFPNLSNF